ncbi:MAG: glycosyltransferase [Anaerolineales bacterium]
MRILLVTDTYFPVVSGVTTVVRELGRALQSVGNQVAVIAPDPQLKDRPKSWQSSPTFLIPPIPNPIRPDHKIALPHARLIHQYIRTFAPDVIHVHTPGPIGVTAKRVARKKGIPIVFTFHSVPGFVTSYFRLPPWGTRAIDSLLWAYNNWYASSLDHIIAPSEFIKTELKSHGVSAKISVVPMWIDPPKRGELSRSKRALRVRWKIPKDACVYLYFGRVEPDKNLLTLLEAFARLLKSPKTVENTYLLIVGRGTETPRLNEFIAAHLAPHARIHTPYLEQAQVEEMFKISDIFVMTGPFEAQSIVTLEAVIRNLRIIVAKSGALPEIAGRFPRQSTMYDTYDPRSLTRAMSRAAKMKTSRSYPSQSLNFYRKSQILAQYMELYRTLAE